MSDQKQINEIVWRACDTFRGAIDPSQYKDYILVMLFLKYLSDLHKETLQGYTTRYGGNADRIQRAMARERFVLPEESAFDHLYAQRKQSDIGERINKALAAIEDALSAARGECGARLAARRLVCRRRASRHAASTTVPHDP